MNRYKTNNRGFNFIEVGIICLSAVILLTAGVGHAWLKNSQVEIARNIDQSERKTRDYSSAADSLQAKIDKKLNIYQLQSDLTKNNSSLVEIPVSSVEVLFLNRRNQAPAPRQEADLSLAQITP